MYNMIDEQISWRAEPLLERILAGNLLSYISVKGRGVLSTIAPLYTLHRQNGLVF